METKQFMLKGRYQQEKKRKKSVYGPLGAQNAHKVQLLLFFTSKCVQWSYKPIGFLFLMDKKGIIENKSITMMRGKSPRSDVEMKKN